MTGNLGAAFEPSRATAAEHDASCLAAAERDASALATRDTSCGPEPDASARAAGDASQGTGGTRRICAWCRGPIPARARRDAVCCSQRCRQARHRFLRTVGRAAVAAGRPLRLAYADPPYPGNARLYRGHRDYANEALARCGEALNGTEEDAPLPPGQFGRVELPGYRQHTGWITEETRFGVQMAVVRDWEGREMAAATIGPNSQVVYLPTPRKRPDPVAAIEGREDDGLWDTSSSDDPDEDPF